MGTINDNVFIPGATTRFFYDNSLITTFTNTFVLYTRGNNGDNPTARRIGSSAGYQSPATGFTVIGCQATADGGSWSAQHQPAHYSDNDAGFGAGAVTNLMALGNDVSSGSGAGLRLYQRVNWFIPPNKYLGNSFFISSGTVFMTFFCRLGRV